MRAFGLTFLGRPRGAAAAAAREVDRFSLAAMAIFRLPVPSRRHPAGSAHRFPCALRRTARRRAHAATDRAAMAHHRAGGREPQLLQRPARLPLHRVVGVAQLPSPSTASLRMRCAGRTRWDCGFPDATPGDAIQRKQLRPAASPGLRPMSASSPGIRSRCRRPVLLRPALFAAEFRDLIWETLDSADRARGSTLPPAS